MFVYICECMRHSHYLSHKIITLQKVATLQASLPILIISNGAEILSHVI